MYKCINLFSEYKTYKMRDHQTVREIYVYFTFQIFENILEKKH